MEEKFNFIEEIINKDIEKGCKKIITRFPPEPNGFLHIGHAKSLCINFGMKDKYKGECNLRFDDTNPIKEDEEYVKSIKEDIKWLGFKWDRELYASDYFDRMYESAVLLIKKGLAYVCDMSAEQIRENRGTLTQPGKESPSRNRSIEENLKLFEEMKNGKFKDGEKVLRAKIDMASPNINMRDPVIYRISRTAHHRTKNKWIIYPLYDFAHPLSDCYEGITHSICTLEFEDHRPLYDWVKINCGYENGPKQIEFARLNMTRTIMSKRYLKKLVDEKVVNGWDDPRMPTLSGLRMRGVPPEAIKNFCAEIGVSKSNSEVDIALFEHFVRDYLNVKAKRAMVVKRPLKLVIENLKGEEIMKSRNNPMDENDLSQRDVILTSEIYIDSEDFSPNPPPKYHRLVPGGMVRLKDSYILEYLSHTEKDGKVTEVRTRLIEDSVSGGKNSSIKVKGVIQWVSAKYSSDLLVKEYDYLINEGEGDFSERLNSETEKIYDAKGEAFLSEAKLYDRFQFMREGYYMACGKKENGKAVFNCICSLKDSYK